jgi:hypothetical protein
LVAILIVLTTSHQSQLELIRVGLHLQCLVMVVTVLQWKNCRWVAYLDNLCSQCQKYPLIGMVACSTPTPPAQKSTLALTGGTIGVTTLAEMQQQQQLESEAQQLV